MINIPKKDLTAMLAARIRNAVSIASYADGAVDPVAKFLIESGTVTQATMFKLPRKTRGKRERSHRKSLSRS